MTEGAWQVLDIGVNEFSEVSQLFEGVFGQKMSRALWDWKYGCGRGVGVGARAPGGRLVAHYGGTYRELRWDYHSQHAVHIGDVMVASEGRAALSHKGPFGLVTEGFFQRYIGHGGGRALGFGFPNDRHMRLGERLGHYKKVDDIFELRWVAENSDEYVVQAVDWSALDCEATVDAFCAELMSGLSGYAAPVRNSAWLRHRYANHPENYYQAFWVNDKPSNARLGAVFLKQSRTSAEPGICGLWELMDWIGSPGRSLSMVAAAKQIVSNNAGQHLTLWCSGSVARLLAPSSPRLTRVCSAAVTLPNTLSADLQWWLTGGDTDFR